MTRSPLFDRLEAVRAAPPRAIVEVETDRAVTTVDLCERADGFAQALATEHGPLRGRRVLLALPPGIGWIESFLGVIRAGGVVVPVPLGAPAAELSYFASDAGATLAVADQERAERLPQGVTVVTPQSPDARLHNPASRPLGDEPSNADIAMLLYTSGTTGKPKGARISHASLAAQTSALREAWAMEAGDVLLHALPMHHLHGIVVAFLTAFTVPCGIRMMSRFDASRVLSELPRATVFMAVPTMYQRLFEAADRLESDAHDAFVEAARALRLATSGSAALPVGLAARWRGVSGALPLERYGMSEIGMALSNPLDPAGRRAGTVGTPLPSVEVRIVDESGEDAETGELWIRGPSVFSGYHEREEATREAFRDGWFTTGDIATKDDKGSFRLLGRNSVDILKSGGEKISALEIEETLREHAAIADVAVVGLPDSEWGDRVTAAVVLAPGATLGIAELRAWCKERLAPYKVPRSLAVVEALPRNAMGKVEKHVLVEKLSTAPTGS